MLLLEGNFLIRYRAKIAIAKNILRQGLDLEIITQVTGLSRT